MRQDLERRQRVTRSEVRAGQDLVAMTRSNVFEEVMAEAFGAIGRVDGVAVGHEELCYV